MSQPDPDTTKNRPHWTAGSIALLVIGVLIMVASGLCTASVGFQALFSPYAGLVLIFGGVPFLIGLALVDTARYHHHTSSGRFGRIVLFLSGTLMLLYGALLLYFEWNEPGGVGFFPVTRLQAGLAVVVISIALVMVALRVRRANRIS